MRNRSLILALGLAGAALAPAGCATTSDPAAATAEAQRPATREAILGSWRLDRIDGAPAPARAAFTLTFAADGQASGTINCNKVSAPYTVEGGRVVFGEGSQTLVGCRGFPDLSSAERSVFGAARSWLSADGRRLVFEGRQRVAFRRATG
jgi:heat shock protein HslJ